MKLYLDCYPCILKQTLSVCRTLGIPVKLQKEIFASALEIMAATDPEKPPVELTARVHTVIKQKAGIRDLYQEQKKISTTAALSLYDQSRETINASENPFRTAVKLAIAGNIIDFGVRDTYDLPAEIKRVLGEPFAIDHLDNLREDILRAENILYLADNAGETVFDRLLIETIQKPVIYAVKEEPILNDAVMDDAIQAGLDQAATLISSGVDSPGTILARASKPFIKTFQEADVIISKGQGNFEALSGRSENIYFLLQLKCEAISRSVGAPVGGLIVKSAQI